MAEKGFGIKQLDILGATGIPLVESKAGLNIRVAGQGPGGIGHTVGIGTTGLTAWLETKANADPDNVTTLNCGIVTANKFYGTFEGTIGGDVAAITLNATTEDVFSVASNVLSADNPSGTNDKLIFWDESATKLTHLEVSTGLTLTDTTLTAEGTTYALKCTKDSDGGTTGTDADPYLFLDASSGTDDAVQIVGSGGLSVTRNDDGKLTITGAAAGGLTLDASVTDILDLTGSALSADDAGSDKIVFWDDDPGGGADGKLTYLSIGSGLTLSGTELTADISGGGGVTDVTVDYTDRSAPCTMPITITTPSTGTKQINIPGSSNAFGAKFVQESEPTGTSVCEGDIWYDTTTFGGGGAVSGTNRQVQFNDGGVLAGAANLEFYKSTTQPALILKPSDTSSTHHGGYFRAQNSDASNWSEITSDGGLELFRSDNTHTYGGPYIDFKNVASGAPGDLDARIQMDHAASGSGASDANFSSITFTTGGGGLGVGNAEERLRIGKKGQLGIAGANYGTSGQVIKSTGATTSVEWSLVIPPIGSTTEVIFGDQTEGAYTYRNTAVSAIHHFMSNSGSTRSLQSYIKVDGEYYDVSDYRLKENVLSLTNGIETVKKLNPVSFDWKNTGNSSDGFLAHELQLAIPKAVDGDKDQMKSDGVTPYYQFVSKEAIIPHLTAALKEAISKIETLEAKVAALESK